VNTVIFCPACGNSFDILYQYCPFCGIKKSGYEPLGSLLDRSFKKIEKVRAKNYLLRLSILEHKLVTMEKELDAFVLGKR
jgi:hypothetical protein